MKVVRKSNPHDERIRESFLGIVLERIDCDEDAIAELSEFACSVGVDYGDAIAELSDLVSDLYDSVVGGE